MCSPFIFDSVSKSQKLDSKSILQMNKRNSMLKYMETKVNDPNLTQKGMAQ